MCDDTSFEGYVRKKLELFELLFLKTMGKKIKIIKLHQEVHPGQYDLKYSNLEGIILYEGVDCYGELYWMGTWGGVSIFPRIDDYAFI